MLQQRNSWRKANSKVSRSDKDWQVWMAHNHPHHLTQLQQGLEHMILNRQGRSPYRSIPQEELDYGIMAHHYNDDTIVIATDGSVQDDGTMGAAATMWQDLSSDRLSSITGEASSTSTEIIALDLATAMVPPTTPKVTILTDSLTSIHILARRQIVDFQRFQEHPSQKLIIDQLIGDLNRVAEQGTAIKIVKVKAHIGEFLNERADYLANQAAAQPPDVHIEDSTEELQCMIRFQSHDNWMKWSTSTSRAIQQLVATRQAQKTIDSTLDPDTLDRKPLPRTYDWLLWKNAARSDLSKIISELPKGKTTKTVYQAISNTYPTKVNLNRWKPGEHTSKQCLLCGAEAETFAHIQCLCPSLQPQRIDGHHAIWNNILDNIASFFPHRDYVIIKEATVRKVVATIQQHKIPQGQSRCIVNSLNRFLDLTDQQVYYHSSLSESQITRIRRCSVLPPSRKRTSDWTQQHRRPSRRHLTIGPQLADTPPPFLSHLTSGISRLAEHHMSQQATTSNRHPLQSQPWLRAGLDESQKVNIQQQRPDAWLIDWRQKRIYILEFTRPYDYTRSSNAVANIDKILKYVPMYKYIESVLPNEWSVSILTFAVGVKGTVDEPAWEEALQALGIPRSRHQTIWRGAIKTALSVLTNIVDARTLLLKQHEAHLNGRSPHPNPPAI